VLQRVRRREALSGRFEELGTVIRYGGLLRVVRMAWFSGGMGA
jgi:hypothetical protein